MHNVTNTITSMLLTFNNPNTDHISDSRCSVGIIQCWIPACRPRIRTKEDSTPLPDVSTVRLFLLSEYWGVTLFLLFLGIVYFVAVSVLG